MHGCKKVITYCDRRPFEEFFTLAEFKEKYVEEENPLPKFKVGDKVRVKGLSLIGTITEFYSEDNRYRVCFVDCSGRWHNEYSAGALELYTGPDTKDETKDDTKDDTKELNLCELLRGHEGEEFFSLAYGVVMLEEIRRGTQRGDSPDFLCVRATSFDSGTIIVNPNGKLRNAGVVDLVPSRTLYEQYPLDPYKAWSVWQEEQKKYILQICYAPLLPDDIKLQAQQTGITNLQFSTTADRDKCLSVIDAFLSQIQQSKSVASLCEEIKAIIEKYSKR